MSNFYCAFSNGSTLNESHVVSESFTLEESLCSSTNFKFGGAESTCITFSVLDYNSVKDKVGIYFQFIYQNKLKGYFVIDKIERSEDRKTTKVTAYDRGYDKLNTDITDWYQYRIGETTGMAGATKELLNTLRLSYIVNEMDSLPLADFRMGNRLADNDETTRITARQFLKDVAEINGRMFFFDYETNVCHFKKLEYDITSAIYPSETLYPSTDLYPFGFKDILKSKYISINYKDEMTTKYNGLILNANVSKKSYDVSGTNTYTVEKNIAISDYNESELRNIASIWFDQVETAIYQPIKNLKMLYDKDVKLGDVIRVYTDDGIVDSIVLQKTTTGIYNAIDTIISN